MKCKFRTWLFIVIALTVIACSSEKERMLEGKWSLTHAAIGGSPSSFWFKGNGTVIAPYDTDNYAMQSEGTYDFTDETHIKLIMTRGYYKGNMYIFEIIKLDDKELQLGSTYEILYLKKTNE